MRVVTRSSVAVGLLAAFTGACSDRQPTMPDDGPPLATVESSDLLWEGTVAEESHGSHEVITTSEGDVECRLTTFEGGGNDQLIHPESNNSIAASGMRFPGWVTFTSFSFANNPSGVTIAVMVTPSHDIFFDEPVSSVSFFYASVAAVTLDAFDAAGNLVATVTGDGNARPTPPVFNVWESIGVDVSANVITRFITRVTVTGRQSRTLIDDVENCKLTPDARIGRLVGHVQELVESDVLDSGNGNALLTTLDQALTAIRGDRPSGANLLNAFIHQVEGLIAGGSLTPGEGQALIFAARFVISLLNR